MNNFLDNVIEEKIQKALMNLAYFNNTSYIRSRFKENWMIILKGEGVDYI